MKKERLYGIILLLVSIFMYGSPVLDGDSTVFILTGLMSIVLIFSKKSWFLDDYEEERL